MKTAVGPFVQAHSDERYARQWVALQRYSGRWVGRRRIDQNVPGDLGDAVVPQRQLLDLGRGQTVKPGRPGIKPYAVQTQIAQAQVDQVGGRYQAGLVTAQVQPLQMLECAQRLHLQRADPDALIDQAQGAQRRKAVRHQIRQLKDQRLDDGRRQSSAVYFKRSDVRESREELAQGQPILHRLGNGRRRGGGGSADGDVNQLQSTDTLKEKVRQGLRKIAQDDVLQPQRSQGWGHFGQGVFRPVSPDGIVNCVAAGQAQVQINHRLGGDD